MTGPGPGTDELARLFEAERPRLTAVAHRVLGSRADAEDAVQEAWLRLARQPDPQGIGNLGAWLTTVVGRVSVDMLRARKVRPEEPYDAHVLEIEVTDDEAAAEPEADAVLAESVGVALLVVLDTLGPAERLAFVLHDMFAVPFDEVGQILGRSTDAAKMLASRARRKVQGPHGAAEGRGRRRAVVDAFLAAARAGDFAGLLKLLDPEVAWRSYSSHGLSAARVAAEELAVRAQRGARAVAATRAVQVNGDPGLVVWGPHGRLLGLVAFTVTDAGRVTEVLAVRDPARLAALGLPPMPTGGAPTP
ncbi:sigma-70 family RNA polymerase sigma factor [Streptomyces sp. NPDC020983]|uniref:sigma-70 family RNA polymerase sigma factor n=1 Tax=Streptomyces sp. NPDC020983 TaxID=3365106 RepID=UPI0037B23EEF